MTVKELINVIEPRYMEDTSDCGRLVEIYDLEFDADDPVVILIPKHTGLDNSDLFQREVDYISSDEDSYSIFLKSQTEGSEDLLTK